MNVDLYNQLNRALDVCNQNLPYLIKAHELEYEIPVLEEKKRKLLKKYIIVWIICFVVIFSIARLLDTLTKATGVQLSFMSPILTVALYAIPIFLFFKERKAINNQIQKNHEESEQNFKIANENYNKNIEVFSFLPFEYHTYEATNYMTKMVADSRANTLNEALSMFDEYKHRQTMEETQQAMYDEQMAQGAAMQDVQRRVANIERDNTIFRR